MPSGFTKGDRVTIISGKHAGRDGQVDSNVFQKTSMIPRSIPVVSMWCLRMSRWSTGVGTR